MLMDTNNQSDQLLLVDLIKKMMDLDPERRIKPQEVLEHPFLVTNPTQSSGDKTVARDNAGQLAASHHTAVPASQRVKAGGVVQQDTNTEQDGCFSCLAVQLADTYYRHIADNRLNNISVLFTVRGSGSPIVTFHNLD